MNERSTEGEGACWEGIEKETSPDQYVYDALQHTCIHCTHVGSQVCGIITTAYMYMYTDKVINYIKYCQLRWRGSLHVHGKYTIKPSTEMYRDV